MGQIHSDYTAKFESVCMSWIFQEAQCCYCLLFSFFSLMERAKMAVSELGNYEYLDTVS